MVHDVDHRRHPDRLRPRNRAPTAGPDDPPVHCHGHALLGEPGHGRRIADQAPTPGRAGPRSARLTSTTDTSGTIATPAACRYSLCAFPADIPSWTGWSARATNSRDERKGGSGMVDRRTVEDGSFLADGLVGSAPSIVYGTGRVCIEPSCTVRAVPVQQHRVVRAAREPGLHAASLRHLDPPAPRAPPELRDVGSSAPQGRPTAMAGAADTADADGVTPRSPAGGTDRRPRQAAAKTEPAGRPPEPAAPPSRQGTARPVEHPPRPPGGGPAWLAFPTPRYTADRPQTNHEVS